MLDKQVFAENEPKPIATHTYIVLKGSQCSSRTRVDQSEPGAEHALRQGRVGDRAALFTWPRDGEH